jgi:hypothetical protein
VPIPPSNHRRDSLERLRREVQRLRQELETSQANTARFVRLELEGRLTAEQRARLREHRVHTEALRQRLRGLWAEFEALRNKG